VFLLEDPKGILQEYPHRVQKSEKEVNLGRNLEEIPTDYG